MMRTIKTAITIALLASASIAHAAAKATLVDEKLNPQIVAIQSMRDGRISYFDQQRNYHRKRIDQFLQWRSNQTPPDQDQLYPMIELTDGQRLRGEWVGADPEGETIIWHHPLLGHTAITLDQLRGYYQPDALQSAASVLTDTITLANGDRLTGIIVSAKASGVLFEPDGQDQPILLSAEHMQRMTLAGSEPTGFAPGHMIYLHDGSRILTQTLAIEQDHLLLEDETSQPISLSKVARIDFASARRRLVGLSSLDMTVVSGGEVFGMKTPPRLHGADILLHAPIQLRYQLPPGAARFGAVAQINADANSLVAWTDFVLTLAVDGKEIGRYHLNAKTKRIDINIKSLGSTLTLGLQSAANGPIMDRLRLRDPVILINENKTH